MGKLYRFSHSVGRGGYHIIVKTGNNEKIFRSDGMAEKVRDGLYVFREKYRLRDLTIAVFPHHVHMIFGIKPTISPGIFGKEVFRVLEELVRNEIGRRDILQEDFYVSNTVGAEPEEVDMLLKGSGDCRRWFWE